MESNGVNSRKIFDSYEVECHDCQNYWLDKCDGVRLDSARKCTSYIATRKVDLPHKIVVLDAKVKGLTISLVCLTLAFLLHIVGSLI